MHWLKVRSAEFPSGCGDPIRETQKKSRSESTPSNMEAKICNRSETVIRLANSRVVASTEPHSMWRMDSDGIRNLARQMQSLRGASDAHKITIVGAPLSHPQLDAGHNAARPEQFHGGRIAV